MINEKELLGALARGYCSPRNATKEIDTALIEDMCLEIQKLKMSPLEKDGIPSFYISLSGLPCCTHRMDESDIPVWCANSEDVMKAMDKYNEEGKKEKAPG